MNSEEQFHSAENESPNTSPRGENHSLNPKKIPGLVDRPSPFYLSTRKDSGHLTIDTGRSSSSHHETSEVRYLYEKSGTVDLKKGEYEFGPETDRWSPTLGPKEADDEKGENEFTFQEKEDDVPEVVSASKIIKTDVGEKTEEDMKPKKGTSKAKEEKEAIKIEIQEKDGVKKKKKKKDQEIDSMPQKKNSEVIKLNQSVEDHETSENKAAGKKKKVKKSKRKISEDDRSDSGDSTGHSSKKKNKEMSLRQMMVMKQHSLTISEHHDLSQDARALITTDNGSFVNSPQSMFSLTKETPRGNVETKSDFCPSPAGSRQDSGKIDKNGKIKKVKGTKKNKKKYELVEGDQEKGGKRKQKKRKHQEHHQHDPKKILLTDGLNLVKLMTDRTNCKKSKFLIILYTFSILWSIVLNSLELVIFSNTNCKVHTQRGLVYLCFALMVVLKVLSISLFNLELVFKQPYKLSVRLIYPLAAQLFCALLQIPQNVYDFNGCQSVNQVVEIRKSWKFLQAALGSLGGIVLYVLAKKKIDVATVKSRLGGFLNKIVKCLIGLLGLAWGIIFFVMFAAQQKMFLPSLFFDFYLYIVLIISVALFLRAKRKLGDEGLKAIFIKEEKKLLEPGNQLASNRPSQLASPSKELVKIEVQQ